MSKQLHSKTGIKDTNWKKIRRKKVIHLCMLQNEAYKKSMTTRAYQGYGNCERKTKVNNNTHKWRGKVDDSQLYMISTWKQWLYIGYIVPVDEVDIQPSYHL